MGAVLPPTSPSRPWVRAVGAAASRAAFVALAAATMITLFATESRAEQFVLFDAKFTFTWDDAVNSSPSKSHFYVTEKNFLNKMRPGNLASPINYGAGLLHEDRRLREERRHAHLLQRRNNQLG